MFKLKSFLKHERLKRALPVAFLLLILFCLLFLPTFQNSFTYHAGETIFHGYSYLKYGNSFNSGGYGILPLIFVAFPELFFNHIDYPEDYNFVNAKKFGQSEFFFYGENDAAKMMFWSNIPLIVLGLLVGLAVFIWAKELYGYKAGLLSLLLFVFSPIILSYYGTVGWVDTILAACIFLTMFFYWRFYKNPSPLNLTFTGIFFGLSMLAKPTVIMLVIAIFLIGMLCIRERRKTFLKNLQINCYLSKLRLFLIVFIIILLIGAAVFIFFYLNEIHPVYTDNDPMYSHSSVRSEERLDSILNSMPVGNGKVREMVKFVLTEVPVPAPHFIQGLYTVSTYLSQGKSSYMLGFHEGSKWWQYILIFLLKNPISFLLLLTMAFIFLKSNLKNDSMSLYFLFLPTVFYIMGFLTSKFFGGVVYFLPIYPFLFVFLGNLVNYKQMESFIFRAVLIILVISYVFVAISSYPDYKSYYNSLAGGPSNGYKISSIDTDNYQDVLRLKHYIDDNNLKEIKINYSSYSNFLNYYGIEYIPLEEKKPQTGLIAVDVYALVGHNKDLQNDFAWLRELEPMDRVGNTVFIYNVTEDDLK